MRVCAALRKHRTHECGHGRQGVTAADGYGLVPCCSYEALGLVATLNPIASGGTERVEAQHGEGKEGSAEREGSGTVPTQRAGANGVPKGYGKIIRDGEGNIVEVQLGEEDEAEEPVTQEEGVEEEIPDPRGEKGLAGWVGLGSDPVKGVGGERDTRVVHGESVWLVESGTGGGCDSITGVVLLVLLSVRRGSGGLPDWRAIGLIWFVVSVGAAVRSARRPGAAVHIQGGARDAGGARGEVRGRRRGDGAGREAERGPADGGGAETGDTEGRRDGRSVRGRVTWR